MMTTILGAAVRETDLDQVVNCQFDRLYGAGQVRHGVPILSLFMENDQSGHLKHTHKVRYRVM